MQKIHGIGIILISYALVLLPISIHLLAANATMHATYKEAVVEKIEFYPKKSENSQETIVRKGVLVRYPGAKATLVICHGFMCDKYDVCFLRTLFPKGLLNYLSFDFRAHGEDTQDQFCTFGHHEMLDVQAAARFIKEHEALKDLPVIVYGFSMGAVASIEAQADDPTLFQAMILDCPFDSSENIIKKSLEQLKVSVLGYEFDMPGKGILEKYMFHPYVQNLIKTTLKTVSQLDTRNIPIRIYPVKPVESIKKINVPCFFIHCKNDEKISLDAIMNLYNNASTDYKKLWITNGRRHFDSFFYNPERYASKLNKYIHAVLHDAKKVINKVSQDAADQLPADPVIISENSIPQHTTQKDEHEKP